MNREYNNRGRDQYNFENFRGKVVVENREQPTRPRSQLLLLQQVKQEVISRLEQSLHNKVLITLGKQMQLEQVKRLWNAEIKIGFKPTEPLLPQTSILEVFERAEIAGQLLLLGNPGAGKTTTMLDLGHSLIDKAIQDRSHPIPVLFNLSSRKDPRQSIPNWLVEELKSKYGVRKDIGKKLMEEKLLLPMLDGLDEVKLEHQELCVHSINQWLQGDERPLFVVVCSRREEYAIYETRLHLNGAIVLLELTDEQIQEYLFDVRRLELWQLLHQDPVLLELIRTPLLLSITVLSYEELSQQRWQQLTSTKQRIRMLLDAYVQKMFRREIESKAYKKLPPKERQTRYWLIFLTRQLKRESQTEFLIEKIQPSWLVTSKQKKVYQWVAGLIFGLSFGLLFGLGYGLLYGLSFGLLTGLGYGLPYGLVYGLVYGLFHGLRNKREQEIKLFETFKWDWSFEKAKRSLISGLSLGLLTGLIFGLSYGLNDGLSYGLLTGLLYVLVNGLFNRLTSSEIDIKRRPNQGIWKSATNALFIALIFGLSLGLFSGPGIIH